MTTYLATYGTLGPGRPNHHQLAGLEGRWFKGIVRGKLVQAGWGADLGFPGLQLDPGGECIVVDVLASSELPRHWPHLDAFEGEGYRRVSAPIETSDGIVEAWIYVVASVQRT